MGYEPQDFPTRQFVSYLFYQGCEDTGLFPADIQFVRNPRNGVEAQVPILRNAITAHTMYWICLALGLNMPPEFEWYQRRMNWAGDRPEMPTHQPAS